ncbi:hypothetical protein T484DRAFT_1793309, partial [Baffinella frigidus]
MCNVLFALDQVLQLDDREVEAEDSLLANIKVMCVDEIDRMLDTLNKYASKQKRHHRIKHPKPTRMLMEKIFDLKHRLNQPFQLVCCSATVGRPIRREIASLDQAFNMKRLFILSVDIDLLLTPEQLQSRRKKRGMDRDNGPSAQGSVVPPTISHHFLTFKRETEKYGLLQYMLVNVCPNKPALLFLPDGHSVNELVAKMQYSGISRALALHDAM